MLPLIKYLLKGKHPERGFEANLLLTKSSEFSIADEVLVQINSKQLGTYQVVVPTHLRNDIL